MSHDQQNENKVLTYLVLHITILQALISSVLDEFHHELHHIFLLHQSISWLSFVPSIWQAFCSFSLPQPYLILQQKLHGVLRTALQDK